MKGVVLLFTKFHACKCEKAVHVSETWRQLKRRKDKNWSKVGLTNEHIKYKKLTPANEIMVKRRQGLASHSIKCLSGVDWKNT